MLVLVFHLHGHMLILLAGCKCHTLVYSWPQTINATYLCAHEARGYDECYSEGRQWLEGILPSSPWRGSRSACALSALSGRMAERPRLFFTHLPFLLRLLF